MVFNKAFSDYLIALGGDNKKTELLSRPDTKSNYAWSTEADYPTVTQGKFKLEIDNSSHLNCAKVFLPDSIIAEAPIVTLGSTFYVFGGDSGYSFLRKPSSMIAAFSTITKEWTQIGDLNTARNGHKVIVQKGEFIVVGGMDAGYRSERCKLTKDKSMQCTLFDPVMDGYYNYPGLIRVPDDFCAENLF